MITTVLFDLDGTLLDTLPDFACILNEQLAAQGREHLSPELLRQAVSSGARAMVGLGFGLDEAHAEFAERLEDFLRRYDEIIPRTTCALFADMDRLLNRLDDAGLRWGIVTNKPSRFTTPLLRRIEDLQHCPVVVCRDEVKEGKPHPEGLLRACELAGCTPRQAIYVGDHPRDIEAGRNAGMATVAAAWGYIPEGSAVEDWGADHIAHTVDDLARILFPAENS